MNDLKIQLDIDSILEYPLRLPISLVHMSH